MVNLLGVRSITGETLVIIDDGISISIEGYKINEKLLTAVITTGTHTLVVCLLEENITK
jgi:hypothetical protein